MWLAHGGGSACGRCLVRVSETVEPVRPCRRVAMDIAGKQHGFGYGQSVLRVDERDENLESLRHRQPARALDRSRATSGAVNEGRGPIRDVGKCGLPEPQSAIGSRLRRERSGILSRGEPGKRVAGLKRLDGRKQSK